MITTKAIIRTKQDIARHTLILNQLKLRHQEILNKLDRYIEEHGAVK